MALTLDLASQTLLLSQSPSLTIFAPTDAAFSHSGQPPQNLMQFHIIRLYYSLRSLKSLPFSAKISTLLSDHSLPVTTLAYDHRVSLNNRPHHCFPIIVSPIFDFN
ncbi:putative fasciclin-like arabinogalactan protein 20 [Prunus yedoensis var. nudiflora]|uniref:Putative fasciclin-like arabinogalactan protein 20 n=1 Tax=Prunus yedoensis var. nudiflora TaxID=2094558 RepID=A0A314ZQ64_PRUYE|nr:putative fasciclin-like arabinogalactan protein 20 [Prunus yedoensis var. nudiflora]